MNSEENENNNSSMIIGLENLRKEYSNLLISYKAAVAEYIAYLNKETQQPCGDFTGNSIGIDQACYNYIWKKAGCGSGTLQPQANWPWQQTQTMDGLINDAYYWATQTDYNHRMGCYGNPGNPYIIIGVGTNGYLYSRQGLDAPWELINDDSQGNIRSICTGADGKTIFCTNVAYEYWYKTSWDAPNWQGPIPSSCCNIGVAQGQDGTLIGVGTDHTLWTNYTTDVNSNHYQTASPSEWIANSGVAIAPDGSIFVVGYNGQIWKKNSYQNLTSQSWQWMGQNTCCVKAITIAPDGTFIGVGTDNQLWTKPSYQDLSVGWTGPYNSENPSCCVVSITTVANSTYNSSNYNTSTQPNYKINSQDFVTIQGQAYTGTGSAGQSSATTLQDCVASCSNSNTCTGATFVSNQCLLRTGDSPVVPSTNDSYAIIPKGKQLLLNMENINQQLLAVNGKLVEKIKIVEPVYNETNEQANLKNQELIQNYDQLLEERKNIEELLNEYETLENKQNQNQIKVTKNYYSYILLIIFAVAVIVLLYIAFGSSGSSTSNIQTGGKLRMNTYYIVFSLIILISVINYFWK
jgi:NADH:ubiquinone oxidoreductase subunit 3 (subunit A)